MVFNLYLNAARPHARRRFGATDIARTSRLSRSPVRVHILPRAVLRNILFMIVPIIARLRAGRRRRRPTTHSHSRRDFILLRTPR